MWKKQQKKKNANKYNAMNDQSKTNEHLVRVPHFQNEIGGDLQHLWETIIKDKMAVMDVKIEDLVRKQHKKAT